MFQLLICVAVIPEAAWAENTGSVSENVVKKLCVQFSHLPAPELYFNNWLFCVFVSVTLPISLRALITVPPWSAAFIHLLLAASYLITCSFCALVINTLPISLISRTPPEPEFIHPLPSYCNTWLVWGLLIVTPGISVSVSVFNLKISNFGGVYVNIAVLLLYVTAPPPLGGLVTTLKEVLVTSVSRIHEVPSN